LTDPTKYALWAAARKSSQFPDDQYDAWVDNENSLFDASVQASRFQPQEASSRHTIALAIADTGDDEALHTTLTSLANQVHRDFDVLVACRPSREQAVHRQIASLVPRLFNARSIAATETADPLALQNLALAQATASYFAVAFSGDRLAPTAIAEMHSALSHWADAAILYSDEDWIDAQGRRCKPRFKSAWDPEAQIGFDLLGCLCLFERTHALEAGGFRPAYGCAAHYDLHCRLALSLPCHRIRHIPAVLYHRRVPLRLSAQDTQAAIAAYEMSARQAAADAVATQVGAAVEVDPSPVASFVNHVRRPLPSPVPRVSILVPTRDRAGLMRNCLRGVLGQTDYPDLEVIVLDNDSIEPATLALFAELRTDARVRVLRVPGPFNFSGINNAGVSAATGEVLLFLNNDIEVLEGGWLREMVGEVMRPDIGCVGAKLLYPDGTVQHAGVLLQDASLAMHVCRTQDAMDTGTDGRLAGTRSYLAVTGACLAIRRSVFDEVGGFDAEHLTVAYNDIDLCLKVSDAGYRNVCTPFASLLHLESASRGQDHESEEKRARSRREIKHMTLRWGDRFESDPYHNPNVLLDWSTGEHLAPRSHQGPHLSR